MVSAPAGQRSSGSDQLFKRLRRPFAERRGLSREAFRISSLVNSRWCRLLMRIQTEQVIMEGPSRHRDEQQVIQSNEKDKNVEK